MRLSTELEPVSINFSTDCGFDHKSEHMSTGCTLFHRDFSYSHAMWTFSTIYALFCPKVSTILDINVRKLGLQVCGFFHVCMLFIHCSGRGNSRPKPTRSDLDRLSTKQKNQTSDRLKIKRKPFFFQYSRQFRQF